MNKEELRRQFREELCIMKIFAFEDYCEWLEDTVIEKQETIDLLIKELDAEQTECGMLHEKIEEIETQKTKNA